VRTLTLLSLLALPVSGCGIGAEQTVPYSCTDAAADDLDVVEAAMRDAGVESSSLMTYGDCDSGSPQLVNGSVADLVDGQRVLARLGCDVRRDGKGYRCRIAGRPTTVYLYPDGDFDPDRPQISVEVRDPAQ
jgi:hypothetical protein